MDRDVHIITVSSGGGARGSKRGRGSFFVLFFFLSFRKRHLRAHVCGRRCVSVRHRCAFFSNAYLSRDLRMHSARPTEPTLAHACARTHTHATAHTHGSTTEGGGGRGRPWKTTRTCQKVLDEEVEARSRTWLCFCILRRKDTLI